MEDLALFGGVHHLMVLCYHLQHPSLYSPEGLSEGIKQLVGFVEEGKTPAKVRSQIKDRVSSRERKFPITARPGWHGSYRFPISWSMTASNVVAAGQDRYVESVRQWAKAVLDDLRESRNLD
jgi:hypothetical protein